MLEIVYASAQSRPFSEGELTEILSKARRNNQRLGVSGLLLFHRGSFLQVLEGEEKVVEALFEKIARDPRHRRLMVIKRSIVTERAFGDWSMGFVEVGLATAKKLDGFNSFFQRGFLDAGRTAVGVANDGVSGEVSRILGEFRSGAWRQHIT